jgi:hypothetical protein
MLGKLINCKFYSNYNCGLYHASNIIAIIPVTTGTKLRGNNPNKLSDTQRYSNVNYR